MSRCPLKLTLSPHHTWLHLYGDWWTINALCIHYLECLCDDIHDAHPDLRIYTLVQRITLGKKFNGGKKVAKDTELFEGRETSEMYK